MGRLSPLGVGVLCSSLVACRPVRRHGLKWYVRARGGSGAPTRGLVLSQLGFCFSLGPGRRSHVGSFSTTVAGSSGEGWKGEADVAILFCSFGASSGAEGLPFAFPLLEVRCRSTLLSDLKRETRMETLNPRRLFSCGSQPCVWARFVAVLHPGTR